MQTNIKCGLQLSQLFKCPVEFDHLQNASFKKVQTFSVDYQEKGSFLMSNCMCFWMYRIFCNVLPPPWNFIPFLTHQLGLSVARSLELSGCLCCLQLSHCCWVQPLASHGIFPSTSLPPRLLDFFL